MKTNLGTTRNSKSVKREHVSHIFCDINNLVTSKIVTNLTTPRLLKSIGVPEKYTHRHTPEKHNSRKNKYK